MEAVLPMFHQNASQVNRLVGHFDETLKLPFRKHKLPQWCYLPLRSV